MSDLCTKNQISGKILTSNLTVAVAVTEHVLHTIFSNFFKNPRHVQCSPYMGLHWTGTKIRHASKVAPVTGLLWTSIKQKKILST